MSGSDAFDELVREADERPVVGWDFSWLGGRLSSHLEAAKPPAGAL